MSTPFKPIVDENLQPAIKAIKSEIIRVREGKTNSSTFFEPDNLDTLALINECDPAKYQRFRIHLKKYVSISALEKLIFNSSANQQQKLSPADELVNLVYVDLELFHDKEKVAFATIDIDDHKETYPIDSNAFQQWLTKKAYEYTKRCPAELTIKTAQQTLSSKARFDGKEIATYLRTAKYKDGYVLDLGDEKWQAIIVNPKGWEMVKTSPVRFWRTENMRALPIPIKGSSNKLWSLLNIPKKDRILVLAFIFECWRNDTMFPILELIGEQGTAKSFTQNIIREFVDPNKVSLRAAPKNIEDLFVSASQNWLVSYNNLSHLKAEMQDALCILSTGGGYSSRKLYTNNEEAVIDVSRPCILNGISSIATAQDLLDRTIRIELPTIQINKPVSELELELKESKSEIFCALLNRFSKSLNYIEEARNKPINDRMADFIILGEAIILSMDKKASFAKLYEQKKTRAATQAIESSPAMLAVQKLVRNKPYEGTYAKLLERLRYNYSVYNLPKSPKGLSDLLKRNAPVLRKIGIVVIHHKQRRNDGYHVSIEKLKS